MLILISVVHYSSYTIYCEGGAKNPLKGVSMKFLVYARNASFVCLQGVRLLGDYVMAYIIIPLLSRRLEIISVFELNLY